MKVVRKMGKFKDLTGMTFGYITVLYVDKNKPTNKGYYWMCKCSCKNKNLFSVRSADLLNGHTKSCGCLQKDVVSKNKDKLIKHKNVYYEGYFTAMDLDGIVHNVLIDADDEEKCKKYNRRIDSNGYPINTNLCRLHRYLMNTPNS